MQQIFVTKKDSNTLEILNLFKVYEHCYTDMVCEFLPPSLINVIPYLRKSRSSEQTSFIQGHVRNHFEIFENTQILTRM